MSLPLQNLPVVQNWDCHSCGDCCRELEAVITDEEKRAIEELDLAGDPELPPQPWFVRTGGWWSKRWALKHRREGGCVFLTSAGRCRLHERFGADVKPFVCRLFPYLLIPAGNHWRLGLRFSCPSVVENKGRPVRDQENDLLHLSHLLEKHQGRSADSAPVPLMQRGQRVAWTDVPHFVDALVRIMQERGDRVERRLRKCLALAQLCRQAKFDAVTGGRLVEFLNLVTSALEGDVPHSPEELNPPGWLGRLLFRTLLAVFARKERGRNQGPALYSRFSRLLAGWRFVRGRGQVPRVNSFLPDVTFKDVEGRSGLPPDIDRTLERYYLVKLNSLQFCGPANFDLPFWSGLESLALTLPMILWLTRALTPLPPQDAVEKAILLVDDPFGGNPLLGFRHNQFFLRTLARHGDLERLIAWYSR